MGLKTKGVLLSFLVAGVAGASIMGLGQSVPIAAGDRIAVVEGGTPLASFADLPLLSPGEGDTGPGCIGVTGSAGSTQIAPGVGRCGLPSRTTLQDRVYFGAYWQILDRNPDTAGIVLGGGYANTRVERSSEGDFFAGLVDKTDARGTVTDVILAFAGAHGADAIQGESILLGLPLDEAARAITLYEQLLTDPRYANARIHVTGHSLGAGYTEYVLAYALATHGASATDRRSDFLGFGAPNWTYSAARHFGIDPDEAASRMVDFTAANDPVLVNGVYRTGINNHLPAFTGLSGLDAALNAVAAHWPTTYASALGLPAWLSPDAAEAATQAVSAQFNTGNSIDPNYGPAGKPPLDIDGSPRREWLQGLGGADRLTGGRGADILTGGGGADRFRYTGKDDSGLSADSIDRISDFSQSDGDLIDLSALTSFLSGGLRFVGTAPFGGGREVRVGTDGGTTLVMIDLNGDRAADMTIRLDGRITLRSADFLLA